MTHLSLFSGIGGIDLAAHWAGFEAIQFVEREPYCQQVLAKNFPGVPIHDDVTTFDGTGLRPTIVSAGFPCQPHSLAGKRKASSDERDLWGEVARVLGESKPRWFLGENVPGLLSSESGQFFGRIINDLALLGYRVGWGSWRASDVGACHRRRRVFIVAYSHGERNRWLQFSGLEPNAGAGGNATDSGNQSSPQANSADVPERAGRNSRADARGRFRPIGNPDWRTWDVKPVVCRAAHGVPRKLDVARLKALGNAVVPQQVFPILQAIAAKESNQ